ncbi:MAG: LysE family translocator [Pseudomonadota bacterium]
MTEPAAAVAAAEFFSAERLVALTSFAFAGTWTPGPNNMMLANSGASFGFRRSVPHALGVALGFPAMAFCVALGLGEAFQHSALLRESLRWGGAAMLLYLAWRVATASAAPGDGALTAGRPFTFFEAAAFQWINPKAWMMAIGVASTYLVGAAPLAEAAAVAAAFIAAGLSSAHGWAGFGAGMRTWLSKGRRLRFFNIAMGVALALFVLPMVLADF